MTRKRVIQAVDSVLQTLDGIDGRIDTKQVIAALEPMRDAALADDQSGDTEFIKHRAIAQMESLALQLLRHGTPDLNGRTVEDSLREFRNLYTDALNGDAPESELESFIHDVRADVLEGRPKTDVIGEYGLEESYSAAVRSTADNLRAD